MQSPYLLAEARLAEIRRENDETLNRRKAEVEEKAPEYTYVKNRLSACGIAMTRSVLEGGNRVAEIRAAAEEAQAEKGRILKRLGLPTDYLDTIYTCTKCRDTGFDEKGHRCQCLKKLVSQYIGINSNMTALMKNQTFENFDFDLFYSQPPINGRSVGDIMKRAFDISVRFAENFGSGENLYFYGDAGKGKTYLSSCIANRVLQKGFSVYYQSAFSMLELMEKLKFGRIDEEDIPAAEYESKYVYDVDLLVIDDVGTEFISAYSTAAMYDVINSRLNNGKSTIISSNLSPAAIAQQYGERMSSRIAGAYTPVIFAGRDLRISNIAKNNK